MDEHLTEVQPPKCPARILCPAAMPCALSMHSLSCCGACAAAPKPISWRRTEARTFLPKGFVDEDDTMTGLVDQENHVFKLAGGLSCCSAKHCRLCEWCRLAVQMITQLVARWVYTLSSSCTKQGSELGKSSLQAVGQHTVAYCLAEGTCTHAALQRVGDVSTERHSALLEQAPNRPEALNFVLASDADAVLMLNHAVAGYLFFTQHQRARHPLTR